LVHHGYEGEDSAWLNGGPGYKGTIRKLTAQAAGVELDEEIEIKAPPGRSFEDFGMGSVSSQGTVAIARGRWLTLLHGWVGQTWTDPVRLHVGLTEAEPDLYAIPESGGIGYWVESHAGIELLDENPGT
jgi:hypothetical protein